MSFRSRFALRSALAATFLSGALNAACVRTPTPEVSQGGDAVTPPPIEQVVDRHAPELMQIPGVTMVYVAAADDGRPCIKVGFATLPNENRDRVPSTLEGWPVLVEETGEIRPLGGK